MARPRRNKQLVAGNRKAYHDYFIEETIEAGIALKGTEVKSLRRGKASIAESYASIADEEVLLYGSHIPEYLEANRFNHYPKRTRKLLLHKREIKKLIGKTKQKGYSLIPLELYFNERNIAKVLLGVAKGKKQHDKRQAIKEKEWKKDRAKLLG